MRIPDNQICIKSSPNEIVSRKNQKLLPAGRILRSSVKYKQSTRRQLLRSKRMLAKYNRFLQAGRALQARQSSHQVEYDPQFRRRYSRYYILRRSNYFVFNSTPRTSVSLFCSILFSREERNIKIKK